MEPQGLWQFENFSSAKEIVCPNSISPPPSSPTLYPINNNNNNVNTFTTSPVFNLNNNNNINNNNVFFNPLTNSINNNNSIIIGQQQLPLFGSQNEIKTQFGFGFIPSVEQEQQASLVLPNHQINQIINELFPSQQQQLYQQQQQQMLNFDDILDLVDLACTGEQSFDLEGQLTSSPVHNQFENVVNSPTHDEKPPPTFIWSAASSNSMSMDVNIGASTVSNVQGGGELEETFQSILDELELELPTDTQQIAQIPTVSTFISSSASTSASSSSVSDSDEEMNYESDSSSCNYYASASTSALQQSQYQSHSQSGSFSSSPSSSSSSSSVYSSNASSHSEDESQDEEAGNFTVDDLLIAPTTNVFRPAVTKDQVQISNGNENESIVEPKQERRGRKPASGREPWSHLKDKSLRKKEQNKTAATRYRQKKKLETMEFLEEEKILLVENGELNSKKGDLLKEVHILKGVLRALFANKKKNQLKRNQQKQINLF